MRNPRRARNISALLALIGCALFSMVIAIGDRREYETLQFTLALVSLTVAPIAIVFMVQAHLDHMRRNRFVQGKDPLARWSVDPARAEWFLGFTLDPKRQPGVPIEVVFAKAAVMVDGDFHALPLRGLTSIGGPRWVEHTMPYLEFTMDTYTRHGSSTYYLRIPIPPGAETEALRVCEHFHARVRPAKPRNFRRRRNLALLFALLASTGGGAGFYAAMAMRGNLEQGPLLALLIVAIFGAITTPVSLLLALVWHFSIPGTNDLSSPSIPPADK